MLNGKKLGGILCETMSFENYLMVILGIGLNVNMSAEELIAIDRPATSLKNETGITFDVKNILKMIEKKFISDLELFFKEGFAPFLADYKTLFWISPKEKIRFHNNINVIEGMFHSINDDGSLNLTVDGTVQKFISGEFV